jgi:hypothetical protein
MGGSGCSQIASQTDIHPPTTKCTEPEYCVGQCQLGRFWTPDTMETSQNIPASLQLVMFLNTKLSYAELKSYG